MRVHNPPWTTTQDQLPSVAIHLHTAEGSRFESLSPSQFPFATTNGSAAGVWDCFEARRRRPVMAESRVPVHNLKAMKNLGL